eukprot:GEMP01012742.1.p1 GENE.GEMP01012742.1~~GEMP01012742.1.p1  ORF type:complete len:649 (+),score=200.39 GEMP01012742.1:100-2046(+)
MKPTDQPGSAARLEVADSPSFGGTAGLGDTATSVNTLTSLNNQELGKYLSRASTAEENEDGVASPPSFNAGSQGRLWHGLEDEGKSATPPKFFGFQPHSSPPGQALSGKAALHAVVGSDDAPVFTKDIARSQTLTQFPGKSDDSMSKARMFHKSATIAFDSHVVPLHGFRSAMEKQPGKSIDATTWQTEIRRMPITAGREEDVGPIVNAAVPISLPAQQQYQQEQQQKGQQQQLQQQQLQQLQQQQQLQLQQQQEQEQQQQRQQEQQPKLLQQQLLLDMKQQQQQQLPLEQQAQQPQQPQQKNHHLAFIPTRNPHVRHKHQRNAPIDQTYVPSHPSRPSEKSYATPMYRKYADDLFPRPKSDAKGLFANDTAAASAQSAAQAGQYVELDEDGNPKMKGVPADKNNGPVFVPAVPRPVSKENTVPRAAPSKVEAILASPLCHPSSKAELIFASTGRSTKGKRRQTSTPAGSPPPFPELSNGGLPRCGFQAAPGYFRLRSIDTLPDTTEKCGFQPAATSRYSEESSGSTPQVPYPQENNAPVATPSDSSKSFIDWMRSFKIKNGRSNGTAQAPTIPERNLIVADCDLGQERIPQPDHEDAVLHSASGSPENVTRLILMGFSHVQAEAALKRCSSIQAAVDFLCAPRVDNE